MKESEIHLQFFNSFRVCGEIETWKIRDRDWYREYTKNSLVAAWVGRVSDVELNSLGRKREKALLSGSGEKSTESGIESEWHVL
jgi:hypothetical protein